MLLWTNTTFSLLFTKSRMVFVEWLKSWEGRREDITCSMMFKKQRDAQRMLRLLPHLLHIWISVSIEKSRSVRRRWCMWDQRNSGMRNMVDRGPDMLPSLLGPDVPPPPAVWFVSCGAR